MLTPQQIHTLSELLERQLLFFAGSTLGPQFLSDSNKVLLKDNGIDVTKMYTPSNDLVTNNYILGMLSSVLGDSRTKGLSYDELVKYITSGQHIPLNAREKATINSLKMQSLADIKSSSNKIFQEINRIVSNELSTARADQEQFIKDKVIEGVSKRQSFKTIARELNRLTGDWSRNFQKSVQYISHTALNEGRAAMLERRYGNNQQAKMFFHVQPDACVKCVAAYLTDGRGSEPVVFTVKQLQQNGNNIGRKTNEWLPTLSALHVNCYDKETEVLTDQGWKLFADLNRSEKFLSVRFRDGNAEWVSAVKWINVPYKGDMYYFKNKNIDLATTENHSHVIKTPAKSQLRLCNTINLPARSSFLKHIPKWIGDIPLYQFDDVQYDSRLFSRFLGFYLSEGSCIDYKGRLTLHISQSKEKYLDEIFDICQQLFSSTSKQKDYVQISCVYKPELWAWLNQFGKSNVKFIPNEIKNSSIDIIDLFLDTYCKGDGSFRNGEWDGYKSKTTRLFFTSSKRMADDLGELMLKIGKCPSYKEVPAHEVFDSKRNKSYMQNNSIWWITECLNKFVGLSNCKVDIKHYDDFVHDVELERNHTLVVRRNGKVVVSGNCRCLATEYIEGMVWDGSSYKWPNKPKTPINRPKVRIVFNDQEYFV